MSKVGRTVLTKTLAAQLSEPNIAEEIAAYLIAEKRTAELDSLVRDLAQYRADNEGIVEVEAVSAHPIDTVAKAQIKAKITDIYPTAKKIIITERHDTEVLGGIRLELANQQLDMSARAKLNRFKQLTAVGEN
jgi:F0F1-type ATP synthase delta subunit